MHLLSPKKPMLIIWRVPLEAAIENFLSKTISTSMQLYHPPMIISCNGPLNSRRQNPKNIDDTKLFNFSVALIVKMAGIVGLTCLKGKTPEKCLDIILDR